MPFVVEDGTGRSDANALASVAAVDEFWADRGGNPRWGASLLAAKKQAKIVLASDYVRVTRRYADGWRGTKRSHAQRMPWPRVGADEYNGQPIAETAIPWQVVEAVCLLAPRALDTELLPDLERGGMIASESIEGAVSTAYAPDAPVITIVQHVDGLLAQLLRTAGDPVAVPFVQPPCGDALAERYFGRDGRGGRGAW